MGWPAPPVSPGAPSPMTPAPPRTGRRWLHHHRCALQPDRRGHRCLAGCRAPRRRLDRPRPPRPGPQRPAGRRVRAGLRVRAGHGQPRRHRRPPARPSPGRPDRHPHRHRPVHHPRPARRPGHPLCHPPRPRAEQRERQPLRLRIRPVLTGRLGRLMVGVSAFEFGNVAATLLILRATELLAPGHDQDRATQLALGLYVAYNVAATLASVPAGRLGDRRGTVLVLALGVGLFGLAYAGFAAGPTSVLALAPWFIAAGVAIGCVETAEHAAVAALAPVDLRGSAFGLLAAVQSFGNLAASAIAGLLWTAVSPRLAFSYLAAWMGLALVGLLVADHRPWTTSGRDE